MKLFCLIISSCIAGIASGISAFAGPIHETYVYKGIPTQWDVDQWSSIPGERGYIFEVDGQPFSSELKVFASLRGADRIRIEVSQFPDETTVAGWKSLAAKGVELIGFNSGLPTAIEIDRLNRIGFSHYLFVLMSYPGVADARKLAALHAPYGFTFAQNMLPRYEDKPGLAALPEDSPLLFVSNYWPWYSHMDVMNLLPQKKTIRVQGIFPTEQHLVYLHSIRGIDQVIVENDMDPPAPDFWARFKEIPVQWISTGHVPDAAHLTAFDAYPEARKLVIDSDDDLTAEERDRLTRSRVSIEWVHLAPGSYSRKLKAPRELW